jgi:hypothetical protein
MIDGWDRGGAREVEGGLSGESAGEAGEAGEEGCLGREEWWVGERRRTGTWDPLEVGRFRCPEKVGLLFCSVPFRAVRRGARSTYPTYLPTV